MRPVATKEDFVRRYQAGEFGNRAPTWDTLEEYLASGYRGLIHIRNRVPMAPSWYNVPAEEVEARFREVTAAGHDRLYFSGMAPTEKTLFQGEVKQTERHLDLFYNTLPRTMREALNEGGKRIGEQVFGLRAILLLRTYLDAGSYDWLQELLENYPEHVIEFSCYSTCWGTVPNRNTVFWEVRLY